MTCAGAKHDVLCPIGEPIEYTGIGLGAGLEAHHLARPPGPQDPEGSSASSSQVASVGESAGTDDLRAQSLAALAGIDDALASARRFLAVSGSQDPGGSSASSSQVVGVGEGDLHRPPTPPPLLCPAHSLAGKEAGPHAPGEESSCGCCWSTCSECQPELDPSHPEFHPESELAPPVPDPLPYSHPPGWTPEEHFGHCGQNCPCCRATSGADLGPCFICLGERRARGEISDSSDGDGDSSEADVSSTGAE